MTTTKILLAEDGDDHARILLALFAKKSFEVTRVKSGLEALEILRAGHIPDLLITDVMMPGMSGFELLAWMQTENIVVPTIVLTGKQREEDMLRGFGYGVVDYITKPFSPAVLMARVNSVLARKKAA